MSDSDSGTETLISGCSYCDCEKISVGSHDDDHCHENENVGNTPPKIQPYSGVLEKGKTVIRPIAFKPIGISPTARFSFDREHYGSTPVLSKPDLKEIYPRLDSLNNYSLDRRSKTRTMCLTSPDSIMSSFNSIPQKLINCDSMDSVRKSPVSTIGSTVASMPHCESFLDLTPSPSDSGISELEAALRDRDSELAYLRQTMEHNEQVIFRVYQEKEKIWERELRKLKSVQETRLRVSAQKIMKLEQTLMMQSYQLQQDKKKFNEEIQKVTYENNKLRKEMALLRERLDETEWNLCQKTGELSLLKSQLKDYQNEQTAKGQEIIQLKTECRDTQNELVFYKSEIQQLKMLLAAKDTEIEKHKKESKFSRNKTVNNKITDSTNSVNNDSRLNENFKERKEKPPDITVLSCDDGQLVNAKWHYIFDDDSDERSPTPTTFHLKRYCSCAEINKLMEQISLKEKHFEKERLTWAQEKEKVLRYQRQLQMDYIQMFKRTKNLENEVENLTIEVELQKNKNRKYPLVESQKQTINL